MLISILATIIFLTVQISVRSDNSTENHTFPTSTPAPPRIQRWSVKVTYVNEKKSTCLSPSETPTLLSHGNGTIVCLSPAPIVVYPLFEPGIPVNYTLTTEHKFCQPKDKDQSHQSVWEFKGILKIDPSILKSKPAIPNVTLYCNTDNATVGFHFRIKEKSHFPNEWHPALLGNATIDGAQRRHNCSTNTQLAFVKSMSRFTCLINEFPNPAEFLQCSDWQICEAFAKAKYTNFCIGSYDDKYCSKNPSKCSNNNYSSSGVKTNGIVICKTNSNTVFLTPIFSTRSIDQDIFSANISSWALVRADSDLKIFIKLMVVESKEDRTQFNCTIPIFLGMMRFTWEIKYGNTSNGITRDCFRSTFTQSEQLVENCVFKHPSNRDESEANISCTVYFYNRKSYSATLAFKIPAAPSSQNSDISRNSLMFVGIGISIASVLLLPALIWYHFKVRRQRVKLVSSEEIRHFLEGAIQLNNSKQPNEQGAMVVPYDANLEIPRSKIKLESVILGSGNFGKVVKGRTGKRHVAVKTIDKHVDGKYFRALLAELKILAYVGKHENIVELVGANTEKIKQQDVLIIYEICENGNIRDYLLARREYFLDFLTTEPTIAELQNYVINYENCVIRRFSSLDLLQWSTQIAAGMEFIASKNVCHGDLAARNILLSRNFVAKVGDFGLAKHLMDYSLYVQKKDCPLPLKWMSIESLRDLEFSVQSDVWSYGVTIWELFSLGGAPYPGMQWSFQAWEQLLKGERMGKASHASPSVHDILLRCWATLPKDRPRFTDLKVLFALELDKTRKRRRVFI